MVDGFGVGRNRNEEKIKEIHADISVLKCWVRSWGAGIHERGRRERKEGSAYLGYCDNIYFARLYIVSYSTIMFYISQSPRIRKALIFFSQHFM